MDVKRYSQRISVFGFQEHPVPGIRITRQLVSLSGILFAKVFFLLLCISHKWPFFRQEHAHNVSDHLLRRYFVFGKSHQNECLRDHLAHRLYATECL